MQTASSVSFGHQDQDLILYVSTLAVCTAINTSSLQLHTATNRTRKRTSQVGLLENDLELMRYISRLLSCDDAKRIAHNSLLYLALITGLYRKICCKKPGLPG